MTMTRLTFFKTVAAAVAGAPVVAKAATDSLKPAAVIRSHQHRRIIGTVDYKTGHISPRPLARDIVSYTHRSDGLRIVPMSIAMTAGNNDIIRDDGHGNLYIVKEQHD